MSDRTIPKEDTMRIIDPSAAIARTPADTPEYSVIDITCRNHAEGAAAIENLLCVPSALPQNMRDGPPKP